MRVSYAWLRELLPGLTVPPAELADRMTRLGLLVEEVLPAARGLDSVVLGRVTGVAPHPSADRLKLCSVETAPGQARRIVCGAPVVKEGAFYPVALPGAALPNGLTVRVSEIRGVRSEGMLCSAPELGLEHLGSAEGILEVDPNGGAPGAPIASVLHLDDTILVLEIPSNRPDWESHLGVARELQELAGGRMRRPGVTQTPAAAEGPAASVSQAGGVRVTLLDPEGCPRYTGRVIRGLRVGPSPLAVQQRLFALGVRPINNVVDATNHVLLEVGTPLHAFDLARLAGGEICVRRAEPGERLVTLDGRERTLDGETTVIADRDRAVAVGGVMGGRDSEVSAATRDVFLEAALFDPLRIRRAVSRLGLRTEASSRFGRGVDPMVVPTGRERACGLILEWSGGSAEPEVADVGAAPGPRPSLELRPERVAAVTGLALDAARVREALVAVDLPVSRRDGVLAVTVPGHRFDLAREIDLVEEVARRVGYDRVPATPLADPAGVRPPGEDAALARLRDTLRGLGLDEACTSTFFDPAPFGPGFFEGRLLEQVNPLAQNEPFLRPTLAATMVEAARHNLRRGAPGVAFFEIGHVFARRQAGDPEDVPGAAGDLPRLPGVDERGRLGILLAGTIGVPHWSGSGKEVPADVYDVKGVAEALLGPSRSLSAAPSGHAWLHPGQQAELRVEGRSLGFLGRLHPSVERALDFEVPVLVADLELAPFLAPRPAPRFAALSPYPRVERDLALVVSDATTAAAVEELLRRSAPADLVELRLFDVYRGDPVPSGARSLAFRLVFQSADRTLTEDDVERGMASVRAALAEAGIRLRS
ncbi:MAG TPA: phenylalanine--tRNA ligase subunit beta [Gemmatimonadota bacterium]|jgi:phenylalanyl-tRNA synthetase beta chain